MARTLQNGGVIGLEKNGELISNTENNIFLAEPNLFKIFDIEVLSGTPAEDFKRPFVVMLSEKAAMRYFNSTDIIGKRLRYDSQIDLEVVGVFETFPLQTHY